MDNLEPANFDIILLLYRGCSPYRELYWHGPVETTELVLYRGLNVFL